MNTLNKYLYKMKKIALLFIALSLIISSCGDKKEKPSENKVEENSNNTTAAENIKEDTIVESIKRDVELVPTGTIPLESILNYVNEDELKQSFGADNVSRGRKHYQESSETYIVTKLFAGSNDEITITWNDTLNVSGILSIICSTKEGKWKTKQGLYVGMPMNEAVAINEAPLTFSGFGWDFGGNVYGYNDGKIKDVRLELFLPVDGEEFNGLWGDVELKTDMENVKNAPIHVSQIRISNLE